MKNNMLKNMINGASNPDLSLGGLANQQNPFQQIASKSFEMDEQEKNRLIEEVRKAVTDKFKQRLITDRDDLQFQASVNQFIKSMVEMHPSFRNNLLSATPLISYIYDDIIGFGPLQPLLKDDSITEIQVKNYNEVYVEKKGTMTLVPEITFNSPEHLTNTIQKIVQPMGRKIDEAEPICDTSLPDGSRVNCTLPPASPDSPTLTIRKFSSKKLTPKDYLEFGSLNEKMVEFLKFAVNGKANIIVAGGTGTGKTSLLNMISQFVNSTEAIVTIEDTLELQLQQNNVRRLLARPAINGKGEITIRRLVKNTLRMRPDRIIVGEIRGGEIYDMLDSMSSGHEGGMGTIHTKSPKHLVDIRIPILMAMSDIEMDDTSKKKMISDAIDLIVYIKRFRDGSRKITNITEVVGYGKEGASRLKLKTVDENKVYIQDIFRFEEKGYKDGKIQGEYVATGYIPKKIIEKAAIYNSYIDESLFNKD